MPCGHQGARTRPGRQELAGPPWGLLFFILVSFYFYFYLFHSRGRSSPLPLGGWASHTTAHPLASAPHPEHHTAGPSDLQPRQNMAAISPTSPSRRLRVWDIYLPLGSKTAPVLCHRSLHVLRGPTLARPPAPVRSCPVSHSVGGSVLVHSPEGGSGHGWGCFCLFLKLSQRLAPGISWFVCRILVFPTLPPSLSCSPQEGIIGPQVLPEENVSAGTPHLTASHCLMTKDRRWLPFSGAQHSSRQGRDSGSRMG